MLGNIDFVLSSPLRKNTHNVNIEKLRVERHCRELQKELAVPTSSKGVEAGKLWLWWTNHWEPSWGCPLEERVMHTGSQYPPLQTSGDGGKWVCDVSLIPSPSRGSEPCLVYSFGSHGHYEFEMGIYERIGCEIHTFDPFTLGVAPPIESIHTHPWGLAMSDYETPPLPWWNNEQKVMRSLESIVNSLGHKHKEIDILKVDIDGVEFGIFDNPKFWAVMRSNEIVFKQLLIEIHFEGISTDRFTPDFLTAHNEKKGLNTGESIDQMLRVITSNGYAMFHKEVNLAANDACEYSFVKLDISC